ncbi:MAG: hypothetical protein HYV07_19935 [Deltaproteobacteria bacterium]|nr:hypothetical protein [Deltaproteobacteria bacterium]
MSDPRPEAPAELSSVDLRVLFRALISGKWWILAAGVVFALGSAFVVFTSGMTFAAKGSLFVTSDANLGASVGSMDMFGWDASMKLATEIEVIRSRDLVSAAIERSGLNASLSSPGRRAVVRFWDWYWSRRDMRLMAPELDVTHAVLDDELERAELTITFREGGKYDVADASGTRVEGVLGVQTILPQARFKLTALHPPAVNEQRILSLRATRTVFESLGRRFTARIPDTADRMANIIQVAFVDSTPHRAQKFVNAVMETYLDERMKWKIAAANATEAFVAAQLEKLGASLERNESDLASFKTSTGFVIPEEEASKLLSELASYEQQRTTLRLDIASIEQFAKRLKDPDVPLEAFMFGESGDAVLQDMSRQLATAQQELKKLAERMTSGAPELKSAQAFVDRQRQMVQSYLETRLERLRQQVKGIDRIVQDMNEKVGRIPGAQKQILSLERSREVIAKLYTFLLERQQEAAINKASTLLGSRVLEVAVLPRREESPKIVEIFQLGLVGLVTGALLVFVLFLLRTTFHVEVEVRETFPNTTILAQVPHRVVPGGAEALEMRGAFLQGLRALRANLYFLARPGQNVLLVTSASPAEGKTLMSTSIARILALDGKRVLLVDADLYAGRHAKTFNLGVEGISDFVRNRDDWRGYVRAIDNQLSVLGRGSKTRLSAELLSSPEFVRAMGEAKTEYDFIVIDSPPFPLTADALLLSRVADLTLSVIRLGQGSRRATIEHIARLGPAVKTHAIVVNDVSLADSYGYGYAYRYAYGSYKAYAATTGEAPPPPPPKPRAEA